MDALMPLVHLVGYAGLGLLLASGLLLLWAICSHLHDRWTWNAGTCRKNGLPWSTIRGLDGYVRLSAGSERATICRWISSEEFIA